MGHSLEEWSFALSPSLSTSRCPSITRSTVLLRHNALPHSGHRNELKPLEHYTKSLSACNCFVVVVVVPQVSCHSNKVTNTEVKPKIRI